MFAQISLFAQLKIEGMNCLKYQFQKSWLFDQDFRFVNVEITVKYCKLVLQDCEHGFLSYSVTPNGTFFQSTEQWHDQKRCAALLLPVHRGINFKLDQTGDGS